MMGKYCGTSIPPSHTSSNKEIMIHFETDNHNGNENGFKMEYNPTGKQNTSTLLWPPFWKHSSFLGSSIFCRKGIIIA